MSRQPKLEQGRVQVYTGNGKGKTTAALGLVLRAAGRGLRVYFLQFMKWSGYGEHDALLRLAPEVTAEQAGRDGFVSRTSPDPEDRRWALEGLEKARQALRSEAYDLVVLDEINCAVDFGLVPLAGVLELIRTRPSRTELVLTGRGAHPEVLALADLVTEMREVRHYFQAGQVARQGIEF